jgi:GNAT superfamily N-acetyltransferase
MGLNIDWCEDEATVPELVAFFLRHVQPSYISHGEVMDDRATDFGVWAPDVAEVLTRELTEAVAPGHSPDRRVALARDGDELVAFALLRVERRPNLTYASLSDLVVSTEHRGDGIGREQLRWLEARLAELGVRKLFLESGVGNEGAHRFFHREGFRTCSVVMVKDL